MDRVSQLRGEAGGSGDSTLDTTSPPSEAYMSANENSSKYFSINDSTFDITPIKDVSLASTSTEADRTDNGDLMSANLSPIGKKEHDNYKIGKQIEAANILSGGVDIFDDNSFDGDELVIDDNVEAEERANNQAEVLPADNIVKPVADIADPVVDIADPVVDIAEPAVDIAQPAEDIAPPVVNIAQPVEEIAHPVVDIAEPVVGNAEPVMGIAEPLQDIARPLQDIARPVEDFAEPVDDIAEPVEDIAEPVVDIAEPVEDIAEPVEDADEPEPAMIEPEVEPDLNLANREMEVILQIDGNNLNAIDIGNGLYLYRKDGLDELAALQIIEGDPQTPDDFKFLKVRYNAEGNLEVYEEIEIRVPKDAPMKKENPIDKNTPHVSTNNNSMSGVASTSKMEVNTNSAQNEPVPSTSRSEPNTVEKASSSGHKTEINLNGKMMKLHESRKSPVVGSFTPMTFHSTSSKEGKPLTKSMVDLQLDLNRHSDNIKKTIEVHTDNTKQRPTELLVKDKNSENTGKNDKLTDKREVKKDNTKNERDQSQPETAKCSSSRGPMSEEKNDKKNAMTKKPVMKAQNNDDTASTSSKEANKEMRSDMILYSAVVDRVIASMNSLQNTKTGSKPNSIVQVLSKTTTKEKAPKTTTSTTESNHKIETSNNITAEQNKLVSTVVEPVLKTNEALKTEAATKNALPEKSAAAMPIALENVQNITSKEEVKKNSGIKLKEAENTSLKITTQSSNVKLNEKIAKDKKEVEDSTSGEIDKFPLESFSDVSNTCTNLENEGSKEESITLYSIDTDESVSLITPSSTTQITNDEVVLNDNISEVLTSIGNFSNTQIDLPSASVEKSNVPSTVMKEPIVHAKDEANNSNQTSVQEICPNAKKTENIDPSNTKSNPKEAKASLVTIPKTKLPEKNASSIPVLKIPAKEFEKTSTNTIVPKVKQLRIDGHTAVPELKSIKPQFGFATEVKSSDKVVILETHPLPKAPPAISAPLLSLPEKPDNTQNVKVSDNQMQPVPKSEPKPLEKLAVSSVVPKIDIVEKKYSIPAVNPSEKIANTSTTTANMKQPEISSATSSRAVKPESHIPIISIANKPSSKHAPVTLKVEGIIKKATEIADQKETAKNNITAKKLTVTKIETGDIKEPIRKATAELKSVNNNLTTAVPFGKWTDAHRQEFVNKFKEVKVPVHTNSKQIKNSNDLNRRDVLQKIDSQRAQIVSIATAKAQEKANVKTESVFSSKGIETKMLPKNEITETKPKQASNKVTTKQEIRSKTAVLPTVSTSSVTHVSVETVCKPKPSRDHNYVGKIEHIPKDQSIVGKLEPTLKHDGSGGKTEAVPREQNTASCYMASLIDRTIEDMINRAVPGKNSEDVKQPVTITSEPESNAQKTIVAQKVSKADNKSVSLDDIEMKMNELHGIPFVERPPHELPKIPKPEIKTYSKAEKSKPISKVPKIIDVPNVSKPAKDIDSDDEGIEHEPITGDIDLKKSPVSVKLLSQDATNPAEKTENAVADKGVSKRETEVITETDFDKFARRNSITYENCLTVNFENKEEHNVVQNIKKKEVAPKFTSKSDAVSHLGKSKLPNRPIQVDIQAHKSQAASKHSNVAGDANNKKYQSKIHSAYQSALTAKHQVSRPITIIEDKPVKVVFLDSNMGFVPDQLNVQGQELSPSKNPVTKADTTVNATDNDSLDSLMLEDNDLIINKHIDVTDDNKQDKTKTKHQRKQVLTPVEVPDLELIQPSDIGIESSSKKKRKLEDTKAKNLVPKKSYLLGRNTTIENKISNAQTLVNEFSKDLVKRTEDIPEHKNAASAIDNLVKAAELLENQAETLNKSVTSNPDSQSNTPVKRGRGRPRKYPLPDGVVDIKTPSPQKKPRLIDAKPIKHDSISDELDDYSSGEEMVRENWTMGKINENIVCPICNKLFRSENVVFKHVKHCTGVSPNRSDTDNTSPHRSRLSQESEDADIYYDVSNSGSTKDTPKKHKSKESPKAEIDFDQPKLDINKDDVIVIEDTPVKETEKAMKEKEGEPKKASKINVVDRNKNNLVCEFCGKTFRQQSYLSSHKLLHKKELAKKKTERKVQDPVNPDVFSCEICKKEFRKLHHLVQHRHNHNIKNVKEEAAAKQNVDASAGFRCEPCDKSFRKLHHLVEHRGTHDGVNRQKAAAPVPPPSEKPSPPPQCEICKKTFRKLHHLIEHKEQHADTNSDKSDDKSIQSALSTKDIIHECALCYMVFPNEHSLNKHSVICSKKRRQSKQVKVTAAGDHNKDEANTNSDERKECKDGDSTEIGVTEVIEDNEEISKEQDVIEIKLPETENNVQVDKPAVAEIKQIEDKEITRSIETDKTLHKEVEDKFVMLPSAPVTKDFTQSDINKEKENPIVSEKIKKIDLKEDKTQDIPKKKVTLKDKNPITPNVKKRLKSIDVPPPAPEVIKPSLESSDDDEIRYMLNPNFKGDETSDGKTFMKVRARKRNSLQIERPNPNDHAKRRTSLQHPPKIPRLKPKAVEPKSKAAETKSKTAESKLNTAETKSKAVETKSKAIETKSKAVESKTKSVDIKTKVVEAKTKVVEAKSKAVEIKSKAFESKAKVPESKLSKSVATKPKEENKNSLPTKSKQKSEAESLLSTDSDDSDVKYSFPKTAGEVSVPAPERAAKQIEKVPRKSLAVKRKSLGGIAKRKSLGKAVGAKHKGSSSPPKPIKKRWSVVEHRCDCGQLFSSAALLARHTSVAHTPPRIRRRRSPPPDRPPTGATGAAAKPSKSTLKKTEPKTESRKSLKSEPEAQTTRKTRRSAAHSGVPVPEKLRRLMQKNIT